MVSICVSRIGKFHVRVADFRYAGIVVKPPLRGNFTFHPLLGINTQESAEKRPSHFHIREKIFLPQENCRG